MTNNEKVEKLKDFKRSLDEGMITQEEYDEQKRLILGLPKEKNQSASDEDSTPLNDPAQIEIEQLKEKLAEEKNKNNELNKQLESQKETIKENQTQADIKQPELKEDSSKNIRIIKIVLDLIGWAITVFLAMLALGAFLNPKISNKIDGLLVILLLAVICPPTSKRLNDKFKSFMKYKPYIILGIILILFVLMAVFN